MGVREAREDGIKHYFDPNAAWTGRWIYEIPCARCGDVHQYRIYVRNKIYVCKICRQTIKEKVRIAQEVNEPDVLTKYDRRFNAAVEKIKKQVKNKKEYENAIKIAEKRKERYGSIPEAMVAIELIRLGYKIIPQQKVHTYKVDFAIPEQKLVIEVDGSIYHSDRRKAQERELLIQYALGLDWNIIHVPGEMIQENIRKLNAFIKKAIKINDKII